MVKTQQIGLDIILIKVLIKRRRQGKRIKACATKLPALDTAANAPQSPGIHFHPQE